MEQQEKNELQPHPVQEKLRQRWIEGALIFAVFFVHGGAPSPNTNETYYLAKAKHYWQPDWCAGDMFLESADAHLTFYWTVGWLTNFFPLGTVAWIGRVAAWGLLACAWQRLSSCIVRVRFASALSGALLIWLIHQGNFAGEWVVGGVEGKCFAYAFVFWGLAAMVAGRWRLLWPWFGAAGAFHVLVGGWSVIVAALVWFGERREDRPTLVSMLPALALGLLLALPGLIPALNLTSGVSAEIKSEASQIYVFDRLPHHLAPLAQPGLVVARHGISFLFLLCVFALLNHLSRDSTSRRTNPASRICRFAWWSVAFAAFGLIWELACWNHPALAASLLKYYWFRLADVAVPLAVAMLVCLWLERLVAERRRWAPQALAIAMLLPTLHLVQISATRFQDSTPPADGKMVSPAAWRDACQWVRDNTSPDAVLLVPRLSQSLSWYAERRSVVNWKDVPQDATTLLTWRDRYYDVYWHVDEENLYVPYRSLADQGTARIRKLAKQYGADFLITREYPPLQIPAVYSNAWYTVYDLSPEAFAAQRGTSAP